MTHNRASSTCAPVSHVGYSDMPTGTVPSHPSKKPVPLTYPTWRAIEAAFAWASVNVNRTNSPWRPHRGFYAFPCFFTYVWVPPPFYFLLYGHSSASIQDGNFLFSFLFFIFLFYGILLFPDQGMSCHIESDCSAVTTGDSGVLAATPLFLPCKCQDLLLLLLLLSSFIITRVAQKNKLKILYFLSLKLSIKSQTSLILHINHFKSEQNYIRKIIMDPKFLQNQR